MIKKIDFSGGTPENKRIYVTQWDYGLILRITGTKANETHFAIEGSADNALVVPLEEEDGILSVNVPDRLLAQEREVYVYLYEETGEGGRTVGRIIIHIYPRAKPEDYIYTPEELKRLEGIIGDFEFTKENIQTTFSNPVFYGGKITDYKRQIAGAEAVNFAPYEFDDESGGMVFKSSNKTHLIISLSSNGLKQSPLMTGMSEFTISYDCKSTGDFQRAWICYICPHDNPQDNSVRDYIGIMDYPERIHVERGIDEYYLSPVETYSGWHHVDVVFRAHGTEIYVNGKHSHTMYNTVDPADLLKGDSVFYIGKANWGDGEYYDGIIKTFRVYNRALTENEIIENYKTNTLSVTKNEDE